VPYTVDQQTKINLDVGEVVTHVADLLATKYSVRVKKKKKIVFSKSLKVS